MGREKISLDVTDDLGVRDSAIGELRLTLMSTQTIDGKEMRVRPTYAMVESRAEGMRGVEVVYGFGEDGEIESGMRYNVIHRDATGNRESKTRIGFDVVQ